MNMCFTFMCFLIWKIIVFQFIKYKVIHRLLPLYFPRDKHEEEVSLSKLPFDVGDENGETLINERKIRIKPLPVLPTATNKTTINELHFPVDDFGMARRSVFFHNVVFYRFLEYICIYLIFWSDWGHITELLAILYVP